MGKVDPSRIIKTKNKTERVKLYLNVECIAIKVSTDSCVAFDPSIYGFSLYVIERVDFVHLSGNLFQVRAAQYFCYKSKICETVD